MYHEDNSICNNAEENELFKYWALRKDVERMPPKLRRCLHLDDRLRMDEHDLVLQPLSLLISKHKVLALDFVLSIVGAYNFAHEQVKQEKVSNYHECHEVKGDGFVR